MMARLGDLFLHIRNGANIKQGLDNAGYPITRIETISNRTVDRNKMGYAGITDLKKYSDFIMQDGDILMSHINSETHLGKTALYEKEDDEIIIHGMNLLSLRPNKDLITSKYAFYYLSSQSFLRQIPNITKKSVNQASFTVSALKELVFPLTSIEEQKKITVDLDKVNDLISLRKQQLSKLDELVKSRFIEMFGDPVVNPRGWETTPLSALIVTANNGMARRGKDEDGSIVLRLVELQNGFIDYSEPNRIQLTEAEQKRYKLVDNDFLFARVNGNPDYVGRCAVFKEIGEAVYHNDHIIRVHFDESRINGCFTSVLINSDYGKRQLRGHIKTSAGQYTISQDGIGAIMTIVPPLPLQTDFATFVEQVDKSKFEIQKSLEKLKTLKKALMQKYFG